MVEVSIVEVEINVVVSALPVVVEGAARAWYASVATQAQKEVAAPAPVGPLPLMTEAWTLVVHRISYQQ